MKFAHNLLWTSLALLMASAAQAGVSAEQAAQLGQNLTQVGAEKAGNSDGTIPPFEGGLPKNLAPAGFKDGDSMRPDPFAGEKPRLVITAKNVDQYKEQLNETTQALLKRYPDYRLEVYPTHRSVTIPEAYRENSVKNATGASTTDDGLVMKNVLPGVPFPIPTNGREAMWNHLLRYSGHTLTSEYDSWNVDAQGTAMLATTGLGFVEYPLSAPEHINVPIKDDEVYYRIKLYYTGPARRAGEALLVQDAVDPNTTPRKAWQYLPGQRRVKLAPDICCDTPNPGSLGSSTYDDVFVFSGSMDRFDWKIVGKKEMYIPYNTYKLTYEKDTSTYIQPKFINPDYVRWELHRVWVIEATLKPGMRHIYSKRRFYLDEDSWVAVASDEYDARNQLFRGSFAFISPSWDRQAPNPTTHMIYDLIAGTYNITGIYGPHGGVKYIAPLSKTQWSPASLAGSGVR